MKRIANLLLLFLLLSLSTSLRAQDSTEYTTENVTGEEESASEEENSSSNTIDTFYQYRIPASTWQDMQSDKDFNYSPPEKEITTPRKSWDLSWLGFLLKYLNYILFVVVGVVILLIIYYVFRNSEFSYFSKGRKKEESIPSGTYEDVYTFSDWEKALQEAIQQGNFRLAVRILYLQTLQKLHLERYIQYEQEKTNWDYVTQLQQASLKPTFTTLTKYFDYIWYGHFEIDEKGFQELQKQFNQFQTGI